MQGGSPCSSGSGPTPCAPAAAAQQYATLKECVSECQRGVDDNNACTTFAVHALAGRGRPCAEGRIGVDAGGNCLPAFGEAKQAYDYFSTGCMDGGANQNEQCRAAAAVVLQRQPGVLDTTSSEFQRSCPRGRLPCAGHSPQPCVAWCARHGVPTGAPSCTSEGKAGVLQDRWASTNLAAVQRDPARAAFDPALAEIASYFDAACAERRGQRDWEGERRGYSCNGHHGDGARDWEGERRGYSCNGHHHGERARDPSTLSARASIGVKLDAIRQMQCATPDGLRDHACEQSYGRRADRELLEVLAYQTLSRHGAWHEARQSSNGVTNGVTKSGMQARAPLSLSTGAASLHALPQAIVDDTAPRGAFNET